MTARSNLTTCIIALYVRSNEKRGESRDISTFRRVTTNTPAPAGDTPHFLKCGTYNSGKAPSVLVAMQNEGYSARTVLNQSVLASSSVRKKAKIIIENRIRIKSNENLVIMNKPTKILKEVKGILSDIDGTLYFKGVPVPGAIDTICRLRQLGMKLLFLTNTDSKVPKTIHKKLVEYGFSIEEKEIFTPIIALKEFLAGQREKKIFLVATKEIEKEFSEFNLISGNEVPDYVIIADFRDNWNVNRLNIAFKYLLKGAELLGTQGNRYFLDSKGEPVIDTGSFAKMLAYAADVPYKTFGKPSKEFFIQALNKLNLRSDECIMIGDDYESDVLGANNVGIKSVLVRTGKGGNYESSRKETQSFQIIDSFKSILDYM